MTWGGWLFMIASVSGVITLAAWCFAKVLRTAPAEVDDAPSDQG